MKHRIMHIVLVAALLITFMPPPSPVMAQASQSVRVGLLFPFNTIDPLFAGNSSEALLAEQLFLGLTDLDEKGELRAELAEKWEVSEDGLNWTFRLRQGVQWVGDNQIPQTIVTATDVVFAFERVIEFGIFGDLIAKVGAVDDFTVIFSLNQRYDFFPQLLAVSPAAKPIPYKLIQTYGDSWTQPGLIWSNGPYLLSEWSGPRVELEVNPFWMDEASIPVRKARLEYIKEPNEALLRYQGGDFEIIELLPEQREFVAQDPALAPELREIFIGQSGFGDTITLTRLPGRRVSYLVKPYVFPTYSSYFGLGGIHSWELDPIYNDPSVSIPDTTRVLDSETLDALQSMSEDQSVLVFERMTPQLSAIQLADIIVGNSTIGRANEVVAPFGFLRRVMNKFTNAEGRFVVETIQAALDEAIERGNVTRFEIPFGDVYRVETLASSQQGPVFVNYVPPSSEFRVTIDHVLYDSGTGGQVKAKGYVELEPEMSFDLTLDVNNYELQSVYFSNTIVESSRVEITSNVELASFDQSIPIKRFTFVPQTILIGWVPVVITPQLTVYVGLNGSVSVGVTTGIEQKSRLVTGVSYQQGYWSPIHDFIPEGFSPVETELTHAAKAEAFAGPELSLKLYGIAGPYGRIKGYLKLTADPFADPWWVLIGGIKAELGMKVEVFSHVVASYKEEIPILEQELLNSGGGLVVVEPTLPSPPQPKPEPSCKSMWWPPTCWTWWIWVIVVIIVILLLIVIYELFG